MKRELRKSPASKQKRRQFRTLRGVESLERRNMLASVVMLSDTVTSSWSYSASGTEGGFSFSEADSGTNFGGDMHGGGWDLVANVSRDPVSGWASFSSYAGWDRQISVTAAFEGTATFQIQPGSLAEAAGDIAVAATGFVTSQGATAAVVINGKTFTSDYTHYFTGRAGDTFEVKWSGSLIAQASKTTEMDVTAEVKNVKFQAFPISNAAISTVTPTYGELNSESSIGTYISGVRLKEQFFVTPSSNSGYSAIRYRFGDGGEFDAVKISDAKWTFFNEMGGLTGGTHKLVVRMLNGGTEVDRKELTITVVDTVTLDLDAKASTDSGGYSELEHLRLLQGIDLQLAFRATVGVTLLPVYEGRLAIMATNPVRVPFYTSLNFNEGAAHFTLVAATFRDDVPGEQADYQFSLVPRAEYNLRSEPLDPTPEDLRVTRLPSWMIGVQETSYSNDVSHIFPTGGGAYVIDLNFLEDLNVDLVKTIFGEDSDLAFLFSGLSTSIGANLDAKVYARLSTTAEKPKLNLDKAHLKFTLLEEDLLDASTDLKGKFRVGAYLDSFSLNVQSINVQLLNQSLLKGETTLIDRSLGSGVGVPTPLAGARVYLTGNIRAQASRLDASANFVIDVATGKLDAEKSYVRLDVGGSVDAALGVKFGWDIASVTLAAKVKAVLSAGLRAKVAGSITSPTLSFDKARSNAALGIGYGLTFDMGAFNKKYSHDIVTPTFEDMDWYPLFGLSLPPTATLQSLNLGTSSQPTALMQSRSFAATLSTATTTATTSALAGGYVDSRTQGVLVDLSVLAAAAFTPEQHYLKLSLVHSDGSQIVLGRRDLAPLAVNSAKRLWFNVPTGQLNGFYKLKVELENVAPETEESVQVNISRLSVFQKQPTIALSSAPTVLADGKLSFSTEADANNRIFLNVKNNGNYALDLRAITLTGANFRLLNAPTQAVGIFNGGQDWRFAVQLIDPSLPSTGQLVLESDDPKQSRLIIPLVHTAGRLPPKITLGTGGLSYKEGQVIAIAPQAIVTDADSKNFAGGKLVVKLSSGAETTDRLEIRPSTALTLEGALLKYNGKLIGAYSGGSGSVPLTIHLYGTTTPFIAQVVLRHVVYRNVSEKPLAQTRTVWAQLADGDGGVSTAVTRALQVTPINDAPVLTGASGTVGYVRDSAAIKLAPYAIITDVDSANFSGGRLRVWITEGASTSNRLVIGAGFTVDANNNVFQGTTIIGKRTSHGFGTTDLIITLNAKATPTIAQQLARAIAFKTVGGAAGQRTVLLTLSDGDGGLSNVAMKKVNVN